MFCKNINDNFDTIVHQVPYESINYPIIEKKKITRQIINHAEDVNADVIISNFAHIRTLHQLPDQRLSFSTKMGGYTLRCFYSLR